jgi:hypothetical protein
MFARIRKNIQTNNHNLIVLLVFLLLLLSSGQELFHNHDPDFEHHHDCPAYQLFLLFGAILIFDCIFSFLFLIFITLKLIQFEPNHSYFYNTYYSRAPPFQILKNFSLYSMKHRILNFQNLEGNNPCIQILNGGVRLF